MGSAGDPADEVGATRAVAELELRVERGENAVRVQLRLVERERAERVQQPTEVRRRDRIRLEAELERDVA